jgi:hypothetical protein
MRPNETRGQIFAPDDCSKHPLGPVLRFRDQGELQGLKETGEYHTKVKVKDATPIPRSLSSFDCFLNWKKIHRRDAEDAEERPRYYLAKKLCVLRVSAVGKR